ncbi:DENN-domain-containing protein, partial [Aureobasidium melanogenum]
MAPTKESTSVPLADYFFISGIESTQIYDEREHAAASPPPVDETIEEDIALETDSITSPRPSTPGSPNTDRTKRGSSRYSWEARKSISSVISPGEFKPTPSNRSSATIKGLQTETPSLSDEDFEIALRKSSCAANIANTEAQTENSPHHKLGGCSKQRGGTEGWNWWTKKALVDYEQHEETALGLTVKATFYTHIQKTEWLQLCHSYAETLQSLPRHAPPETTIRTSSARQIPPKAQDDEMKRRCPFPDYVPMFAFPNDVVVVSSDERPRSTWHGFAMTTGDGSKLHAICVTVWMPLNESASVELERQCEAWRKANMSDEERELASSLGERLAGERAKLSRLLAELPNAAQGSAERDTLDEQISAVEEKISLMADLLRPVRHGAASKIEGLTDGESGFWIPRCYGVLGKDGAMTSFWKEWLKAIVTPMTNGAVLRVPPSSPRIGMWQPLERYVVNLCVEAPSPMSSSTQIEVAIRELRLYARKEAENEIPGSRNT